MTGFQVFLNSFLHFVTIEQKRICLTYIRQVQILLNTNHAELQTNI